MKTNLLTLALVVISSALIAQTTVWNPGAFDNSLGLWINPGNWTNGLPGTTASKTVFNVVDAMDCIIDEDVTHDDLELVSLPKIVQGDNGPGGVIHIKDGGAITTANEWSGIGWNHPAKLIVDEGGEITFGQHMWIAFEAGSGGTEVHIDGGTLNVMGMFGMDWQAKENACTLFLNSGLLNLSNIHNEGNSMGVNAKIEYVGGMMQIKGDHKEVLETLYADKITGDYEIWVEQTITETDTTYVTKLSNEGSGELGTDASLSELALSEGTLDPAFDAATADYTVELPAGTTVTPTVTATPTDANATVIVTDAADITSAEVADRTTTIVITAEDGVTELTYTIVFNVEGTSVTDLNIENLIYPNPASAKLYITHTVKIDRVEIYNITGSRVLSQDNITTEAIDISDLNSGLYFISVIDVNNNNIVRKFIKQ